MILAQFQEPGVLGVMIVINIRKEVLIQCWVSGEKIYIFATKGYIHIYRV